MSDFLRWAKLHRKVRYELTDSGAPAATLADFEAEGLPVSLQLQHGYGDAELIDAISARYNVAAARIVPTPGASSANFIALAVTGDPGDKVMVEWPLYEPIERVAKFLGRRVTRLDRRAAQGFRVQLEDLEAGLGQGVRAVFLTNLHNPSGRLLGADSLREVAELCAAAGATLMVDEVYLDAAHLNADQPRWTAANIADNVIATNSLTKVYGLGGLRVGWFIANDRLAERAREVMDLLSVENASPSALLARAAFSRIGLLEEKYRRMYREGQPVFRRWLGRESLVRGYESYGAIFECVRLPAGITSTALNDRLVAKYDTQVVPGRFFGLDDHIRLSIAPPPPDLEEALTGISRALRELA